MLAQETATFVEQFTDNSCCIISLWRKLTAERIDDASTCSIIWCRRESCRCQEGRVSCRACWESRLAREVLSWGVRPRRLRVLRNETSVIVAHCNGIAADCHHSKFSLARCGGEIGECNSARPHRRHLVREESLYFCPKAWRGGDATKLAEVCRNVVASKVGFDVSICACEVVITTPFTDHMY